MKTSLLMKGLYLGLSLSLLMTQACGKKAKTKTVEQTASTPAPSSSPRTDSYVVPNNGNPNEWQSPDTTVAYPDPTYNQVLTPSCNMSLGSPAIDLIEDFFFLSYQDTDFSKNSLRYCLKLSQAAAPFAATLRLEYQHYYAASGNTLFLTRYTTKSEYLLDSSLSGGQLNLMWMNRDGFIFLKATSTAGDTYTGSLRYTNMPTSVDTVMANDAQEADCLNGNLSAQYCATNFVLHRSFFAKLSDATVSVQDKDRIRAIITSYYSNTYPSAFSSLGIYSATLKSTFNFSLSAAQNANPIQE